MRIHYSNTWKCIIHGAIDGYPAADAQKWTDAPNPDGSGLQGIMEYTQNATEKYREYLPQEVR